MFDRNSLSFIYPVTVCLRLVKGIRAVTRGVGFATDTLDRRRGMARVRSVDFRTPPRRNDNTTGDIYAGNNSSGGAGPKWILKRRIDIVTAGDHVAR